MVVKKFKENKMFGKRNILFFFWILLKKAVFTISDSFLRIYSSIFIVKKKLKDMLYFHNISLNNL